MTKTGGGTGTNQYQVQGHSTTPSSPAPAWSSGSPLGAQVIASFMVSQTESELFTWVSHSDPAVRRAVAKRADLMPVYLDQLAKDKNVQVRWQVAVHPSTRVEMVAALAADKTVEVRLAALSNPHCPPELLQTAIEHHNPRIRAAVAANKAASPGLLAKLSYDSRWTTAQAVGKHANTGPSTLTRLAQDQRHPLIRQAAVSNPNCPAEALYAARADPSINVRVAIAAHHNATAETLVGYIKSSHLQLRHNAVNNPNTPPHIRAVAVLGRI